MTIIGLNSEQQLLHRNWGMCPRDSLILITILILQHLINLPAGTQKENSSFH